MLFYPSFYEYVYYVTYKWRKQYNFEKQENNILNTHLNSL